MVDIDVGMLSEAINEKADRDIMNLTASGRVKGGSFAMPSSSYIDLTLGASGTTYTAPANGWVFVQIIAVTDNSSYGNIDIANGRYIQGLDHSRNQAVFRGFAPIKKDLTYKINYGSANLITHRFIYNIGEV